MKSWFFALVTVMGAVTATFRHQQVRIDDFLKRAFGENEQSKANVIYFILSCEESYLRTAVRLFAGLNSSDIVARNIVTVPIDTTAIRSILFVNNVTQMKEALENYACYVNTEQSSHYDNIYAIIGKILPLLHREDSVLLLIPFNHTEKSTNGNDKSQPTLTQQLQRKSVSINIILSENLHLPAELKELVRETAGKILTYADTEISQSFRKLTSKDQETELGNFMRADYKINVVEKELTHHTRTLLELPVHTFKIYLTLYGDIEKASLITRSGIVINILPVDTQLTKITRQNRSINFNSIVRQSPTTLILSASGERYNITFMTITYNGTYSYFNSNERSSLYRYGHAAVEEHELARSDPMEPIALQQRWAKRQDLVESAPFIDGQLNHMDLQNGNAFAYQQTRVLPTVIDVDFQSNFFALPTEEVTFLLNVKNNKPFASEYHFGCISRHQHCEVLPPYVTLIPQQSIRVILLTKAEGTEGSSNVITFVSQDVQIIYRKIYLYIGKQKSDADKPDIDYEYNGNCDDANTGSTCHRKRWNVEVLARDTGSGLLNLWSEPPGLYYTTEFIVGTKDTVSARYSTSCCDPKVDILAMDLRGNLRKITLDVEHQYLNWIEITTIVLGAILLILLVTILIYSGLRWRRKRNERSFLNN